jgi:hypothetical protein
MFEGKLHNYSRSEAIISHNIEHFRKKRIPWYCQEVNYKLLQDSPLYSDALCEHLLWFGSLIIPFLTQEEKVITNACF